MKKHELEHALNIISTVPAADVVKEFDVVADCQCILCEALRMQKVRKLLEKEEKIRGEMISIL